MRHHAAAYWIRYARSRVASSALVGSKAPGGAGTPEGSRGFFFVSATYRGRSLMSAATELTQAVREAMGSDQPPHLVTLFATPQQEWGAGLAEIPQHVRHLLTYEGAEPPVVIGGVLRNVAGGSYLSRDGEPCVTLLAAHLPGVKIMPFFANQGSLPALHGGSWADVIRAARGAPVTPASSTPQAATGSTAGEAAAHIIVGMETMQPRADLHAQRPQRSRPAATEPSGRVSRSGSHSQGSNDESCVTGSSKDHADLATGASKAHPGQSIAARSPGKTAEASGGWRASTTGGNRPCTSSSGVGATHCAQPQLGKAPPDDRTSGAQGSLSLRTSQGQRTDHSSGAGPGSLAAKSPSITNQSGTCAREAQGRRGTTASAHAAAINAAAPEGLPSIQTVAALLFSTPHFVETEQLLRRFGVLAPGMRVVGGVTSPGAWGDPESNWGAVWLNDRTLARGAVGCVLQGPFVLDTIVSPGFRGAGPVMRVTRAEGHVVLEVDGEPVQRPLQRAISEALNTGDFATSLKIGVGDGDDGPSSTGSSLTSKPTPTTALADSPLTASGSKPSSFAPPRRPAVFPSQTAFTAPAQTQQQSQQQHRSHPDRAAEAPEPQLVTRNWFFQQGPPGPFLTVSSSEPIALGTAIQVHLQNYPAAHREMRDRLRAYAEGLTPSLAASQGSVGALALSCSALPFFEGTDVARCLPKAAFAGGKVEGEFCSTVAGKPSRMHSFASCLALLRAPDSTGGCEPKRAGPDGACPAEDGVGED